MATRKKRIGRPRKSPEEQRDKLLPIWLRDDEKDKVHRAAARRGMPAGMWARNVLVPAADRELAENDDEKKGNGK